MHNFELLLTLAAGFSAALVLGYITHRLGWSPIVGYLVAGVIIGPSTPGFVANRELASQLAEVGVILLMFGVGLHFHLKDLMAVRGIAIAGALAQSAVATALGAWAFHAAGLGWSSGIVLGLALSVASTVVLVRLLADNGEEHSRVGRIAIGWLVMEDILTVFVLVVLPVVFAPPGASPPSLPAAFALTAFKVSAFMALTLYAGKRLVPRLLTHVARTRSRELFTLSVLSLALGIAVGSAYFFDVSMALGAFLAGMVVGQSEFSARAGSEALPMRDAFAVMFFLSVGMLFDPRQAFESPTLTLIALAIVFIGKPLAAMAIVAVLGYSSRIGLGVAFALAQVGEFSFLLATLGKQVGALSDSAINAIVGAAILSIALAPLLYRRVPTIEAFLLRHPRLWRIFNRRSQAPAGASHHQDDAVAPAYHAVVVGYGPIGQIVVGILRDRGIESTIVEMNIDTHQRLLAAGQPTVYGDASLPDVLTAARIESSTFLVLSAAGFEAAPEIVRTARELNPNIHLVARAGFLKEAESLRRAGADDVISGEGEAALAIAGSILRKLGASPEQLDEASEEIREKLLTA